MASLANTQALRCQLRPAAVGGTKNAGRAAALPRTAVVAVRAHRQDGAAVAALNQALLGAAAAAIIALPGAFQGKGGESSSASRLLGSPPSRLGAACGGLPPPEVDLTCSSCRPAPQRRQWHPAACMGA